MMLLQYPESAAMRVNIRDGVAYYTFKSFDELPFVRHGFSTRAGGVSKGIFASMNLGFSRGDDEQSVHENYRLICAAIGIEPRDLVISMQTHGTALFNVTAADRGRGIYMEKGYRDIDGLLTDSANVALCTLYADCTPLLFADPVRRVVASSHAGWAGTADRIGAKTVARMAGDYGCKPENILAGIAPSIGQCCFEVDTPVAERFMLMPEAKGTVKTIENAHGNGIVKHYIDLWEVNRQALINAGLQPQNISVGGLCTRCNHDVFWSHRALGANRGSLAAFIELVDS